MRTVLEASRFDTRVGTLVPAALLYRQQGTPEPVYWSVLRDMTCCDAFTRGKVVAVVRWTPLRVRIVVSGWVGMIARGGSGPFRRLSV